MNSSSAGRRFSPTISDSHVAGSMRVTVVVWLAAAVVGTSTACASRVPVTGGAASLTIPAANRDAEFTSTPPSAPSTLPPDLAGLNRSDASAVATGVVRIWFTADTQTDSSPHAARLRACQLLTAPYCLAIRDFPPTTGPGADWLSLTAQQAAITVGANDIRPADETGPPDSASRADRLLEVTEHLVTPKGPLPDRRIVVAVSLIRDGAQWQAAEVSVR